MLWVDNWAESSEKWTAANWAVYSAERWAVSKAPARAVTRDKRTVVKTDCRWVARRAAQTAVNWAECLALH